MGIKKKKLQKEVEMQKKIVCKYNSQDFAQTQGNFAWSHDRETVTFRNSALEHSKMNCFTIAI